MAGTWALLSVTLCAAVVLCGASGVVAAVESDAVGVDERFGGFAADPLSGNTIFLESDEMEGDAAFETEGETDADAEADELADAESEADADSDSAFEGEEESWTEATGMDSEFDESDAEALADEDEFDVAADEEVEAEIDASAQVTLQSYAASQGALESDADAALASLSSESELSEVEAAAEAEADAEAEMDAEMEGGKDAVAVKGGKKKGKKHAIAKKKALTGLKMSQLNLRDDKGKGAKINLAGGKGRYSMGVNPAGVFTIDMEGRNILSVSGKSGMVRARGDVTVWNTLRAGSLTLNQVPQWKMVRQDTFEKFVALPKRPVLEGIEVTKHTNPTAVAKAGAQITAADVAHAPQPPSAGAVKPNTKAAAAALTAAQSPDKATAAAKALAKKARGWLYDDVIKCNGFTMLSAKPHRSITTLYKRLPKHTQIRVTATVHFIDDWQGETAWLKLNDKFVWTESHDQRSVAGKFSMCGSELYPESRFAAPIDVIWPHRSKKLTLALGSNLDEGSDARFAVSNVAIYTRDTSRRKPKAKFVMKKVCKKDKKSGKEVCKMMKVPVKPHHKPCKKGKDGKCLPKPTATPATPAAPAPAPATPAAPAAPADPAAPSTMPKF